MVSLNQDAARYLMLAVAGVYLVLLGAVEVARHLQWIDGISARDIQQQMTTLSSLTVGVVIGFHLASRHHES